MIGVRAEYALEEVKLLLDVGSADDEDDEEDCDVETAEDDDDAEDVSGFTGKRSKQKGKR